MVETDLRHEEIKQKGKKNQEITRTLTYEQDTLCPFYHRTLRVSLKEMTNRIIFWKSFQQLDQLEEMMERNAQSQRDEKIKLIVSNTY